MPIIDFEKRALVREKLFFGNKSISTKNKNIVREFLNGYDVSPARKAITLAHLNITMPHFSDIKVE